MNRVTLGRMKSRAIYFVILKLDFFIIWFNLFFTTNSVMLCYYTCMFKKIKSYYQEISLDNNNSTT